MRKVTAHLSGNAYAVLELVPGQSDGDRIRWLVDYFGAVLEAKARRERVETAKKLAIVSSDDGVVIDAAVRKTIAAAEIEPNNVA